MFFNENNLIRKFSKSLQRATIIDVGAHIGAFSEYFVKKGWEVIAFEPEVTNRQILTEKIAAFDNVTIIPKAVTDESGPKIPFYTSSKHHGIHTIKPFHPTHEFAYEVETTTLKNELERLAVPDVAIVKVDVEGADFLVLKGFDWERYRPQLVMIEFMDSRSSSNFDYNHHDVADYMRKQGYLTLVSEWSEIQSYGEKNAIYKPLSWTNFGLYPLPHEPIWGNLIFIPKENENMADMMVYWQKLYNLFNITYPMLYYAKVFKKYIKKQLGSV